LAYKDRRHLYDAAGPLYTLTDAVDIS